MDIEKLKPGRAGVSFEQVAAAAQQLLAAGQRPTSRAVRNALGTGSLTTIQAHLAAWQTTQPKQVAAEPVLSDSYKRALHAELHLHASAATAELTEQLAEAVADRDAIAAEAASTQTALFNAQDELAAEKQRVATLAAQLDVMREQLTAAQMRAEQAAQAEGSARAAAAAADARAEAAEQRTKSAEAQAATAAQRVAELTDKLASLAATQAKSKRDTV